MALPNVAGVLDLTDCAPDRDAEMRLSAQIFRLFGCPLTIGAIEPGLAGLQSAGNTFASMLDSARLPTGVEPAGILVMLLNAADRDGDSDWDNGPPFGYFVHRPTGTIVVSTLCEELLAAARRQGQVHELRLVDIPTVMAWAQRRLGVRPEEAEAISNSQFRSLWFQALLARWVLEHGAEVEEVSEPYMLTGTSAPTGTVVRIDKFGNCIVDYLVEDVPGFGTDGGVELPLAGGQRVRCFVRLADASRVAHGQLAAVQSSSGYLNRRHVMICVPGLGNAPAAYVLGVVPGSKIIDVGALSLVG